MQLLNIDQNAKTVKGQKKGYMTAVMYLAPAKVSGFQVCPMSSAGCRAACLNTAGRGAFSTTQDSRINKTRMFFEERPAFMLKLEKEIESFIRKAQRKKLIPVVRLNGTSDIVWEKISFVGEDGQRYRNMMERFPHITFYDYTKRHNRKTLPSNYSLTYSLAEDNDDRANKAIKNGMNVAVVFRTPNFPSRFNLIKRGKKYDVVDGDETDLRFLDPHKVIVALKAKGKAKRDTSGFVRETKHLKVL